MGKIVAKQLPAHHEPVYYYQHSYRVKIHPGSTGKGPGSGPSQVKTESIYLGTADQVRERCRAGLAPQKVQAKAFGWVMTVWGMIDTLGLVDAVDQQVPKRHQGLSPGVYVALGVLAKLCAPATSWRGFGAWIQKTVLPQHWALPPSLLDAQNFWDHWDLLCPETTMPPTNADAPILDTDTVFRVEEAVWKTVQDRYHLRLDEVLYDATNCFTFFQPQTPATVAQKGHNKAGRDDHRQIGLALAATRPDGLPLLSLVYQGNCHDAKLFPESMTRLIDRVTHLNRSAHHLLIICDRGNNSEKNFRDLIDPPVPAPTDTAGERLRIDVVGGLIATHHRDLLKKPLAAYQDTREALQVWHGQRTVLGLKATVVMTFHAGLAKKQRHALQHQIQQAHDRLQEYWDHRTRGSLEARQAGLAALQATLRGGRYWTVTVNDTGKLVWRANRAARAARYQEHGKRLLFTTDLTLTVDEILTAYNHDKPRVEDAFRTLKAPDLIRIQPIRHWTDSKIRVYALICVLALLVLKLLERNARQAELVMSPAVMKTELEDLQEIYLEMNPTTIQRVLTTPSTIQQKLFKLFDLDRYAPKESGAVPIHLTNG